MTTTCPAAHAASTWGFGAQLGGRPVRGGVGGLGRRHLRALQERRQPLPLRPHPRGRRALGHRLLPRVALLCDPSQQRRHQHDTRAAVAAPAPATPETTVTTAAAAGAGAAGAAAPYMIHGAPLRPAIAPSRRRHACCPASRSACCESQVPCGTVRARPLVATSVAIAATKGLISPPPPHPPWTARAAAAPPRAS
jgi:hypothetical protein